MPDEASLEGGFAALSQFFVGDKTMHETLDRVTQLAAEALPAVVAHAGMTMMEQGQPATPVFTDPIVPELDRAQYDSGSGPCLDAFRTGEIVSVASTFDDHRYREFSRTCVEHGILSTLSVPLTAENVTNGALNLYARTEHAFGPEESKTARLFAAQAAIVLANATAYWSARARAEQLEEAMQNRGVIEQAKGIIMSTMRCDAEAAFEVLVKQSQQQNRKLREIASEIAAHASRRP